MRCCNHIPTVHVFLPRYNSIQGPGWDLEGSASKLLTCIHCKDWSVSLSYDDQITWFMARGKSEKQPFQMNPCLRQHLFSVQRYSSNTGQVWNMSMLLEVTVFQNIITIMRQPEFASSYGSQIRFQDNISCTSDKNFSRWSDSASQKLGNISGRGVGIFASLEVCMFPT